MSRYADMMLLAQADIKTANMILGSSNDELMQNIAAYHAQQAVEKLLKAQLEKAGSHPGLTHDIGALLLQMDALQLAYPVWLAEDAFDISRWATTIRYNVNFKADRTLIARILSDAEQWRIEMMV